MSDAEAVLKKIRDEEIPYVDLRFTDAKGKWQHLTMAARMIDEDTFADGIMFDGSSIAGWKASPFSLAERAIAAWWHRAAMKHGPLGCTRACPCGRRAPCALRPSSFGEIP